MGRGLYIGFIEYRGLWRKLRQLYMHLFFLAVILQLLKLMRIDSKPMKLKNAVGINFVQLQAFIGLGVFESTFSYDEEMIHSYNLIPDAGLSVSKLF